MKKTTLKIEGMSCSACSNGLEKYLNKQSGIKNASVNLVMATAYIEHDDNIGLEELNNYVSDAGFESLGEYKEEKEEKASYPHIYLIVFGALLLFMMYLSMGHMLHLKSIGFLDVSVHPHNYMIALIILTVPFLIYGFDILKSGIKNLIHKMPNMDTLVTISVCASIIYSTINLINGNMHNLYFESSAMVIYFVKLGRFIEGSSYKKTREAIKDLVQITPSSAFIKDKNGVREVTIDEVQVGDTLICKPGQKIAVDGIISSGEAHLDESFITGESTYSKKSINDSVLAGSINIDGILEYKAQRIGKNSTISQIVDLVVKSTSTKPKIQRIADNLSMYFVPFVFIIAVVSFIINLFFNTFGESFNVFASILVVACPCALGIGTPLAIVTSEGVCAKKGIFIKSGQALESINKIDTIVFDKTGILTYGNLRISKIFNYSKYSEKELLRVVSSIENNSTHPISNAFKIHAQNNNIDLININNFKNITGIGLKASINKKDYYVGSNKLFDKLKIINKHVKDENYLQSNMCSIVYVIENKEVIGLIGVKDIVRDNIKDTIKSLNKMGKNIIMLSGDNSVVAKRIADLLGIENVIGECMPSDKEKYIRKMQNNNHKVMMIGDGINDAPALSTSDVSISINSATDIAANSSDIILMNDDINKIVDLFKISKKTIKIVKENLLWAFFYNIIMIIIATGIINGIKLTPMHASIAMVISSIGVCINSLRLKN